MMERTAEAQRMAALRDWLAEDSWSADAAACLLAGVLPPEAEREPDLDPEPEPLRDQLLLERWLPGRPVWEFGPEAWLFLVKRDIALMEKRIATIGNLGFVTPAEVLAFAMKGKKSLPPWLPVAQADPVCAEHLPEELRRAEWRADVAYALAADPHSDGGARTDDSHLVACFMLWLLREDAKKHGKRIPGAKTADNVITGAFKGARYSKQPSKGSFAGWITAFGKDESPEQIFSQTFARNKRERKGLTASAARAEAVRLVSPYLGKSANN